MQYLRKDSLSFHTGNFGNLYNDWLREHATFVLHVLQQHLLEPS